jgi:hypothetical protein
MAENSVSVVVTQLGPNKKSGLLKLIVLIGIPLFVIAVSIVAIRQLSSQQVQKEPEKEKEILLSFPMKDKDWQDLGSVFEPMVTLPIKTKDGSFKDNSFLLDSGAVISSLPRNWADETGQDLAFLPRQTFRGFGNTTSFAYMGQIVVSLGKEEYSLPVVFTEAEGTKSLLGRKGFFDDHTINFDHVARQININK